MPVFHSRMSRTALTWILTALAFVALVTVQFIPTAAQAELRAFRLKIKNAASGSERRVITRFDPIQYPMYNFVAKTEAIEIEQTWMCYERSDFKGSLCGAPAESPAANTSGGPGLQDRSPAAAPVKR